MFENNVLKCFASFFLILYYVISIWLNCFYNVRINCDIAAHVNNFYVLVK